jgi:hypothetical protein
MVLILSLLTLISAALNYQIITLPTEVPGDERAWIVTIDALDHDDEAFPDLPFGQAELAEIASKLAEKGDIPETHLQFIGSETADLDSIREKLSEISSRMKNGDRLIFIFRGLISIPSGASRELYLIPKDGTPDDRSSLIGTETLNEWLVGIKGDRIILLDCYSTEENLFIFYASRRTFGTSAIAFIDRLPSDGEDALLSRISSALDDPDLDSNGDRKVTVLELYEAISRGGEPSGVSAITGEPGEAILTLPSAIAVKTEPPDAKVILNGKEVGGSPCMIVGPRPGLHEVRVERELYLIPEAKLVRIRRFRGDLASLDFKLVPIKLYGEVTDQDGQVLPETYVYIEGTQYIQRIGEDGRYSFDKWEHGLLKPGRYEIVAEYSDTMVAKAQIEFKGFSNLQVELRLKHRSWDEISRIRYQRGDELGSAEAFEEWAKAQKGPILSIPQLEGKHAELVLGYFADKAEKSPDQLMYQLISAHLSDLIGRKDLSKRFWRRVKSLAPRGSPEREAASRRLSQLYRGRNYAIAGASVGFLIVLASGAYTILRRRRRV